MARIHGRCGVIYLGAAGSAVPVAPCVLAEPNLSEDMVFEAELADWQGHLSLTGKLDSFSDRVWLEIACGIYFTKDECVRICYGDKIHVSFEEMERRRIRVDQEGLQSSGLVKIEIAKLEEETMP